MDCSCTFCHQNSVIWTCISLHGSAFLLCVVHEADRNLKQFSNILHRQCTKFSTIPPLAYSEDTLLELNKRCDQQHCYDIKPSLWSTLTNLGVARKTCCGCHGSKNKRPKIKVHITPKTSDRLIDVQSLPLHPRYLVELPAAPAGAGQKPKLTNSLSKTCLRSWNACSIKKKTASITDLIIHQKLTES